MATLIRQDDYIKTALRLPRALHTKLLDSAMQGGRSLNAEIIACLQKAVDAPADEDDKLDALLRENADMKRDFAKMYHILLKIQDSDENT